MTYSPANPAPSSSSTTSSIDGQILQCIPFQGFWRRLSSLKLGTVGLDQSPIPITGYFPRIASSLIQSTFELFQHASSIFLFINNRFLCPIFTSASPKSLKTNGGITSK
ncbi:Ubiquitin-like modifier-activating enzyme atg7 [Platanthera zijinensis]|uniref:Ubiquitin-like modifier-activating enzyme atg7 n=1 Tax=Platanthera zijinensis TaxID=2320716 RepID=A0AAP0ATY1_9ASPA